MTRVKGVSEWYQSIGLTCPSFSPNFYFFLGPHGPLNSKKRSLLQSSFMESCLAAHSVADPGCLSKKCFFYNWPKCRGIKSLPGHFSTVKSIEEMFTTADEDVFSANMVTEKN
jgi:hypothetical protein